MNSGGKGGEAGARGDCNGGVGGREVAPDSRVEVHVHSSSCDYGSESDVVEMNGSPLFRTLK